MRLSDGVAEDCRAERFTIHLKHITPRIHSIARRSDRAARRGTQTLYMASALSSPIP